MDEDILQLDYDDIEHYMNNWQEHAEVLSSINNSIEIDANTTIVCEDIFKMTVINQKRCKDYLGDVLNRLSDDFATIDQKFWEAEQGCF